MTELRRYFTYMCQSLTAVKFKNVWNSLSQVILWRTKTQQFTLNYMLQQHPTLLSTTTWQLWWKTKTFLLYWKLILVFEPFLYCMHLLIVKNYFKSANQIKKKKVKMCQLIKIKSEFTATTERTTMMWLSSSCIWYTLISCVTLFCCVELNF